MFQQRDEAGAGNRAQVVLTMADGSVLFGSLRMSLSGRLADTLNNAEQFLDFQFPDGRQQFIAKPAIRSVRSAKVPRADQLDGETLAHGGAGTGFDPYAVLKVEKGASADDIRSAYHRMARLYHPDRLAAQDLPPEVMDYIRAMLVRINLAYEQIGR